MLVSGLVAGSADYALPAPGSPFICDHSKSIRDGRPIGPPVRIWEKKTGTTVVG